MSTINQIHYTICGVGNASYIAANKGWFHEALEPLGATPVLLQSLPKEHWKSHFDYQDDALFREGGNIPPLWAKSNGTGVVLLGAALLAQKQYIIVRADSPIDHVEQLRKYKIGIPVRTQALIDFHKATAEEGFQIALAARGISLGEANLVPLRTEGDFHSVRPDPRFASREVEALDSGEVDAIYVKLTQIQKLLDTGKFRVLFDLSANPSLLAPINNEYPNILTVSKKLAEERPEVVVAYVKQVLRAGVWAKTHRTETLQLLAEQTHGTPGQTAASYAFDFHKHLTLNLAPETLNALQAQKRFLYDNGYLAKDFDLSTWVDDRFLNAAWAQLQAEEAEEGKTNAG